MAFGPQRADDEAWGEGSGPPPMEWDGMVGMGWNDL